LGRNSLLVSARLVREATGLNGTGRRNAIRLGTIAKSTQPSIKSNGNSFWVLPLALRRPTQGFRLFSRFFLVINR